MDQYPKSENIPDYPDGDWVDEKEWKDTGIEEVFTHALEAPEVNPSEVENGEYAIYAVNDLDIERLIPLEYDPVSENFDTVAGTLDSNPGKSQRHTSWSYRYTPEELEKELETAMDKAKLVELEESHAEIVSHEYGDTRENELFTDMSAAVAGVAAFFKK